MSTWHNTQIRRHNVTCYVIWRFTTNTSEICGRHSDVDRWSKFLGLNIPLFSYRYTIVWFIRDRPHESIQSTPRHFNRCNISGPEALIIHPLTTTKIVLVIGCQQIHPEFLTPRNIDSDNRWHGQSKMTASMFHVRELNNNVRMNYNKVVKMMIQSFVTG